MASQLKYKFKIVQRGINSQKNVELSDATGALNAHTEEQTESQASKDLLTKECDQLLSVFLPLAAF